MQITTRMSYWAGVFCAFMLRRHRSSCIFIHQKIEERKGKNEKENIVKLYSENMHVCEEGDMRSF